MKRTHPNVSRTATCVATCTMIVLGLSGCRSSSNGVAGNSFLAPDRVPPPSTRALLPGQAQPYYQGDPMPAMQSAKSAPANAVAANPNEVDARSSTGRTLAWTQPGSTTPAPTNTPTPPQNIVAANEASVAVPTDADPLRFALPVPQVPEIATPITAAAPPTNMQPRQPVQPAPAPPAPGVLQASYNAPAPVPPPTFPNVQPMTTPQQVTSPWRSPQIAQPTSVPTYIPQPTAIQPIGVVPLPLPSPPIAPAVQPQFTPLVSTMGATLREVASPAQPGDPMPRVRMPDYVSPQQITTADGFRPRTSMQ
jgi:hypothetical protein